jgi:NitT/TauT family transport system substrate-binding protein
MDRGIFEAHGIEILEIREGQGSISGAQILANKQADVAIYIDPGAVVRVRAEGGLIKAVAQITPYLPLAVLSKGPDQLRTPEDLIGKTIAIPPGTTQAQLFPAFLTANNMDAAEINIVNIPPETMQASLAEGQIDGFVSFATSQIPVLESLGVPDPYALVLADFGFEYRPGETIVFHEDTIAENPDLVRRFVAAFEESIAYTIENPESMVEVGTALFPQVMSAEVIEKQWARAAQSIVDEREAGQPYTYMRPEQWQALVQLLVDYADLADPGPADQFYTTEFIPAP